MPRTSQGVYVLPAGNPVQSDTIIEADLWANPTMEDLAAEMTGSLSRDGKGGMRSEFSIADGTEAAPGLSFVTELSSGMFRTGAGDWGLAVLGAQVIQLLGTAVNILKNLAVTGTLNVSSTLDVAGKTKLDDDVEITGDLGVGTDTPGAKLHVLSGSAAAAKIESTSSSVNHDIATLAAAATGTRNRLRFLSKDDTPADVNYASVIGTVDDTTAGALNGGFGFQTVQAGINAVRLFVKNGIFTTNATGGDQGPDTVNAKEYYKNGNPVTVQDVAWSIPGAPTVSQGTHVAIGRPLIYRLGTVPVGFMGIPASGTVVFTMGRYDVNNNLTGGIGSMTFSVGLVAGVWTETTGSDIPFVVGDRIAIISPADMLGGESLAITAQLEIN